ncbi:hypothetical protein N234_37015 [Ralstonia pickettii DTP0602]|nr:hypothetical protein N234_37015 [Ralstonia pickettii DTP0602]
MQAERDPATPRSTDQPATGLPKLPRDLGGANMQDSVYSALFEGIVTGRLRPGERLLIDDVAEHFGVSKIPVREALKALEGKGWVESAPRRGTYVRKLSMVELHELFELRQLLEPAITGLAAHRRRTLHLQQLSQLVDEGIAAIERDDYAASSRANSQFHSVIAEAAGNHFAHDVIRDIELRLRRYFVASEWEERKESLRQHVAIFEAIRAQDVAEAERLTRLHLAHTESMAARGLPGIDALD